MQRKQKSISTNLAPLLAILLVLLFWQFLSTSGIVSEFMLPSPKSVLKALVTDFPLLMQHSRVTLTEALLGLFFGVLSGCLLAIIMDRITFIRDALYPLLVLTQTVPTVAIAPLLTIWLGFGILPKVVLIVITIFFPVAIGLLNGFSSVDPDEIRLMQSMGAKPRQILRHSKIPAAAGDFFAALKIAITYALIGAVISEWLGGFEGLGVYMTRVRKSYSFDKMFAVIFLISALSLLLLGCVALLEKVCLPWRKEEEN